MTDDDSLARRAYQTEATARAAEFGMRSALIGRVVGTDTQAGIDALTEHPDRGAAAGEAEYKALTQEQQLQLSETVLGRLRHNIVVAATGLRSVARLLDIDDSELNPDYVALTAAMLTFGCELDGRLHDPTDADA
jgi:hypothetical protein